MPWARVQEQVSNHTQVCSYDIAGMSWSKLGPMPRTYMRIDDDFMRYYRRQASKEFLYLLGILSVLTLSDSLCNNIQLMLQVLF